MAIYASSVMVVGTVLKIWNSVRIQIKLEEQERLLLHARMEALQNQINPHFLFNTLNSVSSLVRFDPDTAREMIIKLANILRRLLNSTDAFVPLREELEFIDNYLDIEVVRFGQDKLQVVKEHGARLAGRHGSQPCCCSRWWKIPSSTDCRQRSTAAASSCAAGSTIRICIIEVEDDGVGMGAANCWSGRQDLGGTGIGMANVAERLKVLYGDTARMTIDSHNGKGTLVRFRCRSCRVKARSPRTALRRTLQYAAVKVLVLRNDLAGAESIDCADCAAGLAHGSAACCRHSASSMA